MLAEEHVVGHRRVEHEPFVVAIFVDDRDCSEFDLPALGRVELLVTQALEGGGGRGAAAAFCKQALRHRTAPAR